MACFVYERRSISWWNVNITVIPFVSMGINRGNNNVYGFDPQLDYIVFKLEILFLKTIFFVVISLFTMKYLEFVTKLTISIGFSKEFHL